MVMGEWFLSKKTHREPYYLGRAVSAIDTQLLQQKPPQEFTPASPHIFSFLPCSMPGISATGLSGHIMYSITMGTCIYIPVCHNIYHTRK